MSLWRNITQVESKEKIFERYSGKFPIELREIGSQWIEDYNWDDYIDASPMCESFSRLFYDQFFEYLITNPNLAYHPNQNIKSSINQMHQTHFNDPTQLIRNLKWCLDQETAILKSIENPGSITFQNHLILNQDDQQLSDNIECLMRCTRNSEDGLRNLLNYQERFVSMKHVFDNNLMRWKQQLVTNGQTTLPAELNDQKNATDQTLSHIFEIRRDLMSKYKMMCDEISKLQEEVIDNRLFNWRRQQQLSGNGAYFESSLEQLQIWVQNLADLIWQNRQQLNQLEFYIGYVPYSDPSLRSDLKSAKSCINNLLSTLITNTFVIEKQPPQVLKKEAKFTATVRLMTGAKLNMHMSSPNMLNVTATIISEEQAKQRLRDRTMSCQETSGEILNNTGPMEFNSNTQQLSITFRNMQLKKIRRADKKGSETVTEEKFSILFQSEFSVGNGDLHYQVWTLSLPVVVTVHGNQECNALATILWDNAFAKPRREPFDVPDRVPWVDLATTLNTKFLAKCGRGLTDSNIMYLAYKIMGKMDDYSQQTVSWSQFNREPLPGRNFTFWEWFYQILKLTKDWLLLPWQEGLLEGFIDKHAAEDKLLEKQNGTFLFRFSDSEIGGISVAWVHVDKTTGQRLVSHLSPLTEKGFKLMGLADSIKHLNDLIYLYPDIPKDDCFGKFYSALSNGANVKDGYIKIEIQAYIPEKNSCSQNQSELTNSPHSTISDETLAINYDDSLFWENFPYQ